MDVGYVEKTFETYINAELLNKYGHGWAPGQHEEGFVGFDFYFHMPLFLQFFRFGYHKNLYRGVNIRDILRYVEHEHSIILRKLPSIKVNMLLQYKCPEYMHKFNSKEGKYWNKDYYRYKIDMNQQQLIQNIHDNFTDVIVLYAAPAINSADQLSKCALKKKIIKNTNFTEGSKLRGHKVNTYVEAGNISKAFSEPEIIESFNLERMRSMFENKKDVDNIEFCINFSNQIKWLINQNSYLAEGYKALVNLYIDDYENALSEYPLADALITTSIFRDLTGITRFCYI